MALTELKVPDMGDFKDVEVIEVLVKAGDTIAAEQSLITVESDKASMEIPSSASGVVQELKVRIGDKINKGDVLALVEGEAAGHGGGADPSAAQAANQTPPRMPAQAPAEPSSSAVVGSVPQPSKEAAAQPAKEAAPPPAPVAAGDQTIPHGSPSIRKFARELGVDLHLVKGSGPKGRITQDDVRGYVKAALAGDAGSRPLSLSAGGGFGAGWPAWPSLDFSAFGATESVALSRIKKISGPNLARNWASIPHVTQFDEADITELEEFRKVLNERTAGKGSDGIRITMLAFVMKACVAALKQFPHVNSSLDAEGANLLVKKYYHLGFAADTPNGLIVPVIRDVDRKGVVDIAKETGELAAQARAGKLGPTAMQGASFTISSLGGIGGTSFTPIINAPEVAILGLSKSELKPKWNGKTFEPRLILPLSLAYDHRVIDGAQGARFTTYLAEVLSDMRRVLL